MEKEIKWIDKNEKLCEEEIEYVQAMLSIKLPKDYVDCIKNNDGAYPSPNTFNIENREEILSDLLSLHKYKEDFLLEIYEDVKDRMLDKIIPFARDPFGNLICFDYRSNNQPTIVFWEHEKAYINKNLAITHICNTFNELLFMLHEFSE